MTEFYIFGSIAALGLGVLFIYSRRIHASKGMPNVIVRDWRKATYYPGAQGEKVSPAFAEQIYERDDWQCQYPGCSVRVYAGNANTKKEHALGLAGAKPGNINHRFIPFYYGGPAIPENLEVMCQPHNIKRGKKIPHSAFKWLAERGETICLDRDEMLAFCKPESGLTFLQAFKKYQKSFISQGRKKRAR